MSSAAPDRNEIEPLIETVEIRTHFRTPRGIARAVDGVTFKYVAANRSESSANQVRARPFCPDRSWDYYPATA